MTSAAPFLGSLKIRYHGILISPSVNLAGSVDEVFSLLRRHHDILYGPTPHFIFNGKVLKASDILRDVGIMDGSAVLIYVPCSGGLVRCPRLEYAQDLMPASMKRIYTEFIRANCPAPGVTRTVEYMEPVTGWKCDPEPFLTFYRSQPELGRSFWPKDPEHNKAVFAKWSQNNVQYWFVSLYYAPPDLPRGRLLLFLEFPKEYPFRDPAMRLVTRLVHPIVESGDPKRDGGLRYLPGVPIPDWSPGNTIIKWSAAMLDLMTGVWDDEWRQLTNCRVQKDHLTKALRSRFEATYRVYCARHWTPASHSACNVEMKRAARLTLLLHKRQECILHTLPKDLVLIIIQFIIGDLSVDDEMQHRADVVKKVEKALAIREKAKEEAATREQARLANATPPATANPAIAPPPSSPSALSPTPPPGTAATLLPPSSVPPPANPAVALSPTPSSAAPTTPGTVVVTSTLPSSSSAPPSALPPQP